MLSNIELATFCTQLGMLIHSGISIPEGISIMQEDITDPSAQTLLAKIYEGLEMQQEFSEILKETGEFPKYTVDMIRIGNYSGKLDDVLSALSGYYQREEQISSGIKSAITYPAIMIYMLFVVLGVLIGNVLPIFQDVYRQLGTDLTGPARAMLDFSHLLQGALPFVIIFLILTFLLLVYLFKKKTDLFSHLFLNRRLANAIAVGRFAGGLSLTISSGLDTDESLKMTGELTDHPLLQDKIKKCQASIQAGNGFAEAISEVAIFNSTQSRMIAIGIRSGALEKVMEDIANQCNEEVDTKIQQFLSILEPALVAILAIIVGIVLLSMMLPLMGIMSQMGL